MTNKEVIKTIKANYPDKQYDMLWEALDIVMELLKTLDMAMELLKAQEPRVMTVQDWKAAHVEKMPAWVEWGESAKGECADYGKTDGWAVLNVDEFVDVLYFGGRCWTAQPTDKQRKAVKWE